MMFRAARPMSRKIASSRMTASAVKCGSTSSHKNAPAAWSTSAAALLAVSVAIITQKNLTGDAAKTTSCENAVAPGGGVDCIIGAQWGDEGKGKLVDVLNFDYDICARVAGGSNAGHTIVANGKQYKFHLVPSGVLNSAGICLVGNGVVVHLREFVEELAMLEAAGVDYKGRLLLSDRAHIVLDLHQRVDALNEQRLGLEGKKLGTTGKGIGPTYSSKAMRNGLRVGDLEDMGYFEERYRSLVGQLCRAHPELAASGTEAALQRDLAYFAAIRPLVLPMLTDTVYYSNAALAQNKSILVEGANATMLDVDFGTYPFVTSSNASIGGVCTGLGVPPTKIRAVIGIVKAYCTRVGEGPFPSELFGAAAEELRRRGAEYGATTGRPRRCGWLDLPQVRYAAALNGFTCINLTKLDVLTGYATIKIGTRYLQQRQPADDDDDAGNDEGEDGKVQARRELPCNYLPASLSQYSSGAIYLEYEELPGWHEDISQAKHFSDLPANAQRYVLRVEELLGLRVRWVGVGTGRENLIDRGAAQATNGDDDTDDD